MPLPPSDSMFTREGSQIHEQINPPKVNFRYFQKVVFRATSVYRISNLNFSKCNCKSLANKQQINEVKKHISFSTACENWISCANSIVILWIRLLLLFLLSVSHFHLLIYKEAAWSLKHFIWTLSTSWPISSDSWLMTKCSMRLMELIFSGFILVNPFAIPSANTCEFIIIIPQQISIRSKRSC